MTSERPDCRSRLEDAADGVLAETGADVSPATPLDPVDGVEPERLELGCRRGRRSSRGTPASRTRRTSPRRLEPAAPAEVASIEGLVRWRPPGPVPARHALVRAVLARGAALRRDPGHVASSVGLAGRAYRRAEFAEAEALLASAVDRLTNTNANPADTTAIYLLGWCCEQLGRDSGAYEAGTRRPSWARAWRAPAGYRMARLDARAGRDEQAAALARLADVRRIEPDHLQALALAALLLRRVGPGSRRRPLSVRATARARPARLVAAATWTGCPRAADAQTLLDVAIESPGVGEHDAALACWPTPKPGGPSPARARPRRMRCWRITAHDVLRLAGRAAEAARSGSGPARLTPPGAFPARLADVGGAPGGAPSPRTPPMPALAAAGPPHLTLPDAGLTTRSPVAGGGWRSTRTTPWSGATSASPPGTTSATRRGP